MKCAGEDPLTKVRAEPQMCTCASRNPSCFNFSGVANLWKLLFCLWLITVTFCVRMRSPLFYEALIQFTVSMLYYKHKVTDSSLQLFIIWWDGCHWPLTDSTAIFLSIKQYWANFQWTSAPVCASALVVSCFTPPTGCFLTYSGF